MLLLLQFYGIASANLLGSSHCKLHAAFFWQKTSSVADSGSSSYRQNAQCVCNIDLPMHCALRVDAAILDTRCIASSAAPPQATMPLASHLFLCLQQTALEPNCSASERVQVTVVVLDIACQRIIFKMPGYLAVRRIPRKQASFGVDLFPERHGLGPTVATCLIVTKRTIVTRHLYSLCTA